MEFEDLKEGDNLYNLIYWSGSYELGSTREMRSVTIKKVRNKSCSVKGKGWIITRKEFGNSWFTSKRECYERALKDHQIELEDFEENTRIFSKEVKYLKKKLNEVTRHSSHK